ncbi:MAG TPA: carbohydrate-binding protein, partial [Bacteroidales bacterium]|nr:carbohydrate-binding protein [Bacteroidales bacterium]
MRLYLYHIVASLCMVLFANFLQAQPPEGFTWQDVKSVDFGSGANHFTIEAASAGLGGEVELHLDAADGIVIGRTFFHQTGSPTHFMKYECDLSQTVSGTHDVFMNFLDYAESKTEETLNIGDFQFTLVEESPVKQVDSLHVYPPVPGLEPSPYYEIQIQKVSELNSDNLADVTNWETAFAWFTQCKQDETGYYSHYIGGWSDTYTNFELDPNTPIVVKITRRTDISDGAPSGPITSAAVHPARKVDSCKVINGAVYIIMSNPALVAVDIDGQMDTRKSPRALPSGWGSDSFPYSSKEKGAHSVTIFANPFIKDKPNPDDPGVLVVKAGEKIPDNLDQVSENIIYFEPGIHKASVDVNAQGDLVERNWEEKDIIHLGNNKSYYIPGDAIVYGNFRSDDGANIRVYGHGVISGLKIMHFSAFEELGITVDEWKQRGIVIEKAKNCHVEGITMENPGFHTFGFHAETSDVYQPSSITWTKMIGWRPNSDGLSVSGNLFVEDCFIRSQDDGIYSGGAKPIRRCVFWHDVNGQTFRGDFMTRRIKNDYSAGMPQQLVAEDIDIIYARGVFNTSDNGFGIIGVGGGSDNETLPDGTENTGQMFIFRNIKISDPLPTRNLLSFDTKDEKELKYDKKGDYAGIRFENIDYQGKQIFGWRDQLDGSPEAALRNFVFDNVSIDGEKIDANYVNDPASCIKNYVSDFTFRLRDTISSTGHVLIRTATNGSIKLENTQDSNEITVIAIPGEGYRFSGWSGDLSVSDSIATIIMDEDKAITANFSLITYSIDTTATNGTIIFEPAGNDYLPGTKVTAKAVGNLGYGFDAWSGDLEGTDNPITLLMDGNKTISA